MYELILSLLNVWFVYFGSQDLLTVNIRTGPDFSQCGCVCANEKANKREGMHQWMTE